MTEAQRASRSRWHYLFWTSPVILAFLFYFPAIDNFFSYDDFIWLHKAKTLLGHPGQIFQPDVVYFDPIVHLSFWIDYKLADLNYRWFHMVDIALHGLNALLLYLFVNALSKDRVLAWFSSLVFVTTFATVDAVVWSSSRVDLFAVTFSLATLIAFDRHLAGGNRKWGVLAVVAHVCALGCKGTPLVVPALLLGLLLIHEKGKKSYLALAPFVVINVVYLVLLKLSLAQGGKPFFAGDSPINLRNFNMALAELFIPERFSPTLNFSFAAVVLSLAILALAVVSFGATLDKVKLFGLCAMVAGIVPVLILKDFKPVTSAAVNVLTSPSHRIYFASIGMALFCGSTLRWISRFRMLPAAIVCLALLLFNFSEVTKRVAVWQDLSEGVRRNVTGLLQYKGAIKNDGVVGLVNFVGSRGFLQPMLQVYFDVDSVMILPIAFIYPGTERGMFDDAEILKRADRCSLFVAGGRSIQDLQVFNLSGDFRQVLYSINRTNGSSSEGERRRELEAYRNNLLLLGEKVEQCKGWMRLG